MFVCVLMCVFTRTHTNIRVLHSQRRSGLSSSRTEFKDLVRGTIKCGGFWEGGGGGGCVATVPEISANGLERRLLPQLSVWFYVSSHYFC